MRSRGTFLLLLGALMAAPAAAQTSPPGGELYQKLCSQCHGVNGDGQGAAAPRVLPRPRDFTAGKFKIRHTPSGALPTDDDLRTHCRQVLAGYKVPKSFHWVPEVVRSPAGKPDYAWARSIVT